MKVFLIVCGSLLTLVGGIWFFQGLNVLLGSFMSGQPLWMWIGAGTAIVGAVLFILGLLRKKPGVRRGTDGTQP
jgi:hypothetical protein